MPSLSIAIFYVVENFLKLVTENYNKFQKPVYSFSKRKTFSFTG